MERNIFASKTALQGLIGAYHGRFIVNRISAERFKVVRRDHSKV